MIRRLIILLLIVGCEDDGELPEWVCVTPFSYNDMNGFSCIEGESMRDTTSCATLQNGSWEYYVDTNCENFCVESDTCIIQ